MYPNSIITFYASVAFINRPLIIIIRAQAHHYGIALPIVKMVVHRPFRCQNAFQDGAFSAMLAALERQQSIYFVK